MKTMFILILMTISLNTYADLNSSKFVSIVVNEIPSFQTTTQDNAKRIIPIAVNIAKEIGVSPELVVSVIWTESHFKSSAKSNVGANGLMQIMPKTRIALLKEMKNFNSIISKNLNKGLSYTELESLVLGTYYLKKLNKRFKSKNLAILAYNMGPTWVSRKIASKEIFGDNHKYLIKVSSKMNLIASN